MAACARAPSRLLRSSVTFTSKQHVRRLSLHEYQSQDLLRKYRVPVPAGRIAQTPIEVKSAIEELGGRCNVSPQILHSRRRDASTANETKIVYAPEEGETIASEILGGSYGSKKGPPVTKVYISSLEEESADEWSLGMTIDRETYRPVILLSKTKGAGVKVGVTSETIPFSISTGITPSIISRVSELLGVSPSTTSSDSVSQTLQGLYSIFNDKDGTNLEITRLARTKNGDFTCLSTAFTFDDAAAKRQPELFALRDATQDVPEEVEAEKYGIVYVRMDGNIGNVVNGAGLAMATNDAIGLYGGRSANFLDAGGQATKETMVKAFGIIIRDERVKTIFVNIYGGITDGRMIAESIIGATQELGPIDVPMVVRLQGTYSMEGLKMLEEADLGIHVEADFGEAAKLAVQFANKK